jgi:GT2 family glycosyltransferase
LASIRRNDYPADLVELIVADNGSTDGSAEVAARAGATVLTLPGLRVGALRNRGADAAHGQILAFVDADHEIDPAWITCAVAALQDETVAAAGTLCEPPSPGTWVQRGYDQLRRRVPGVRRVEWLGSGNVAIRREVFRAAGGFDETLSTCEDVDLCRRIRQQGWAVVSDSRMRSVHHGDPSTLAALFWGELWRARGNVRASLRPPIDVKSLPSVAIPMLGLMSLAVATSSFLGVDGLPARAWTMAIGVFAALAAARTVRMTGGDRRPAAVARAFAVACTYDLARALAPVVPVAHAMRRWWR